MTLQRNFKNNFGIPFQTESGSIFKNQKCIYAMRFWKPRLRVKLVNFDYSAKLLSADNESNKPNRKSIPHIGFEKSLVDLGVPRNELSRKSKSKIF